MAAPACRPSDKLVWSSLRFLGEPAREVQRAYLAGKKGGLAHGAGDLRRLRKCQPTLAILRAFRTGFTERDPEAAELDLEYLCSLAPALLLASMESSDTISVAGVHVHKDFEDQGHERELEESLREHAWCHGLKISFATHMIATETDPAQLYAERVGMLGTHMVST